MKALFKTDTDSYCDSWRHENDILGAVEYMIVTYINRVNEVVEMANTMPETATVQQKTLALLLQMTWYQRLFVFLCSEANLYLFYFPNFKTRMLELTQVLCDVYNGWECHPLFDILEDFVDIFGDVQED